MYLISNGLWDVVEGGLILSADMEQKVHAAIVLILRQHV